jgi:hypothetical protein
MYTTKGKTFDRVKRLVDRRDFKTLLTDIHSAMAHRGAPKDNVESAVDYARQAIVTARSTLMVVHGYLPGGNEKLIDDLSEQLNALADILAAFNEDRRSKEHSPFSRSMKLRNGGTDEH